MARNSNPCWLTCKLPCAVALRDFLILRSPRSSKCHGPKLQLRNCQLRRKKQKRNTVLKDSSQRISVPPFPPCLSAFRISVTQVTLFNDGFSSAPQICRRTIQKSVLCSYADTSNGCWFSWYSRTVRRAALNELTSPLLLMALPPRAS